MMTVDAQDVAALARMIVERIDRQKDRSARTLHTLRRALSRQLEARSGREIVEIAGDVLRHDEHPHRFIASAQVFHHPDALKRMTVKSIEEFGRGMDSWGDVDVFAGYISGPAWRIGRLKDHHIHRWARSSDRRWRRTALVSTVALNRKSLGGDGDVDRTLVVCEILCQDTDDMVIKALSWALRGLICHDAGAVRRFIDRLDASLPRRVVREVVNKLDTGVKNPRR